jgi:small subunit ribosomal protein S18
MYRQRNIEKKNLKPRKKRICRFCSAKDIYIDFKDDKRLVRFLTEQGKIIPRRTSGNCAKHQRQLALAVKRARHLALIPFVADIAR